MDGAILLWFVLWGPPFWFGTLGVQCTLRVHDCSLLYCLSLTWGPPFWFSQHIQASSGYILLYFEIAVHPSAPTHNACSWLATNITWQSGCSLYIMAQMGWTMVFIMAMCFNWSHDHLTTWPHDHLTTWPLDHMTTWPLDHMTTWPLDHMTTWPHDHLTIWPPSDIRQSWNYA